MDTNIKEALLGTYEELHTLTKYVNVDFNIDTFVYAIDTQLQRVYDTLKVGGQLITGNNEGVVDTSFGRLHTLLSRHDLDIADIETLFRAYYTPGFVGLVRSRFGEDVRMYNGVKGSNVGKTSLHRARAGRVINPVWEEAFVYDDVGEVTSDTFDTDPAGKFDTGVKLDRLDNILSNALFVQNRRASFIKWMMFRNPVGYSCKDFVMEFLREVKQARVFYLWGVLLDFGIGPYAYGKARINELHKHDTVKVQGLVSIRKRDEVRTLDVRTGRDRLQPGTYEAYVLVEGEAHNVSIDIGNRSFVQFMFVLHQKKTLAQVDDGPKIDYFGDVSMLDRNVYGVFGHLRFSDMNDDTVHLFDSHADVGGGLDLNKIRISHNREDNYFIRFERG